MAVRTSLEMFHDGRDPRAPATGRAPAPTGRPALLRRLDAFQLLTGPDRGRLAELCRHPVRVAKGTTLVAQGDPLRRSGVLVDGWAVRLRYLPDGRRQVIDVLMPGSLIAAQAALFERADHTVTALNPAEVAWTGRDAWAALQADAPRVALALGWIQQCDDAVVAERLASLGQRTARERIAHLLVELWERGRRVGLFERAYMELPVTQAMLGDALGLSTVHVNRSMQALRRAGLIEQERGGVHLHDLPGLRQAAVFEDDYLDRRPPAAALWDRLAGPDDGPAPAEAGDAV